jgi:hypothetical protein
LWTSRLERLGATITVRFHKKRSASSRDVLDALDSARKDLEQSQR